MWQSRRATGRQRQVTGSPSQDRHFDGNTASVRWSVRPRVPTIANAPNPVGARDLSPDPEVPAGFLFIPPKPTITRAQQPDAVPSQGHRRVRPDDAIAR